MELSKKTTLLFSPQLHLRLSALAAKRRVSLGELVREACEAQFGIGGSPERIEAARALGSLALPIPPTTSPSASP